jgi:hypothetical protein
MDHTSDALRALVLTYYRLSVRNDLYSYFSMLLICGGRGIIPAQTRGRAHLDAALGGETCRGVAKQSGKMVR